MKMTAAFVLGLLIFLLTLVSGLEGIGVAGAQEKLDCFGFSFTPPDRWSEPRRKPYEDSYKCLIWLKDNKQDFGAIVKVRSGYPEKMIGEEVPFWLKRYSEGYGYTVSDEKRWQVKIGSGQKAEVVQYRLNINGNIRDVGFVYVFNAFKSYIAYSYLYEVGELSGDIADALNTMAAGMNAYSRAWAVDAK